MLTSIMKTGKLLITGIALENCLKLLPPKLTRLRYDHIRKWCQYNKDGRFQPLIWNQARTLTWSQSRSLNKRNQTFNMLKPGLAYRREFTYMPITDIG